MRCALAHPEQPPVYDLEGRGLQVDQEKQPTVLGRGHRTVLVGRVPSGEAWRAIETPTGPRGPKGRLTGRRERLTLVHGETVNSRPSVGRVRRSVNPKVPMAVASLPWRPRIP